MAAVCYPIIGYCLTEVSSHMRIVVEASDYILRNIGDIAMQQVAIARLNALFPEATIQVFTEDPESLAFYCPKTTPLATAGRQAWWRDGYLFDRLYQLLPESGVSKKLQGMERAVRQRWPSLAAWLIRSKMKRGRCMNSDLN